jgi:ATP synthase F1 epsilon subunit
MASDFQFRLVTPGEELVNEQVSEVIVPAYDGEAGVLADHEDFVGLLGTGALKLVREGNDYWYLVSSGVYEVKAGTLTVLTELGEEAKEFDVSAERARVAEIEELLAKGESSDTAALQAELKRAQARIEVQRRTSNLH